ncbi:probable inactive receptor kinase [Tanacetum coccineum]
MSLRTHSRPSRLLTKSDPVGRRHTLRIGMAKFPQINSKSNIAMVVPGKVVPWTYKHEWNLTQLRTLSLRRNRLSGVVPSDLELCTELRVVNFQDNMFSGDIPTSLYRLRNLFRLDISGNNLSGVFPPDFGDLRKLTYLNVSMNRLSGRIPNSVAYFPPNFFVRNDLSGPPISLCKDRSDDGNHSLSLAKDKTKIVMELPKSYEGVKEGGSGDAALDGLLFNIHQLQILLFIISICLQFASAGNEANMYNAKCGYIHLCYQGVKSLFNAISGEHNSCKEWENRGAVENKKQDGQMAYVVRYIQVEIQKLMDEHKVVDVKTHGFELDMEQKR